MSLKRILGTILASHFAGRGRRHGPMGSAAMMTGLRRRRRSSSTAGLAALGYMAYKAYQDRQSRQGGATGQRRTSGSGLEGMVQDVVDRVTGGTGTAPEERDLEQEGAGAAENISDETALLLIRAMITAAYSDGALDTEERARIMQEIDEAGGEPEDRRTLEVEIANPRPLDELLDQVRDEETAEEFYLVSCTAVDGETGANRRYLDDLRDRLGLTEEQAREIEDLA